MKFSTIIQGWFHTSTNESTKASESGDFARLEDRIVFSAAPIGDLTDADLDINQVQGEDIPVDLTSDANGWEAFGDVNDFSGETIEALSSDDLSLLDTVSIDLNRALNRELVFVDTQTDDYQILVADLLESRSDRVLEVVLIDSQTDGLALVTETLEAYSGLDAIHFVSHGTDGSVQLGNNWLSQETLEAHVGDIARWGSALSSQGDILFYGCDLASSDSGLELIDTLGAITDADIAASDDLTGHADRGGDWEFEYLVGVVEADGVFSSQVQASWQHTLAPDIASTDEVLVNQDTALPIGETQTTWRGDSSIGVDDSGNYVVAFTQTETDAGGSVIDTEVFFQLFDKLGVAQGGAVQVNQETNGFQDNVSVAVNEDGRFIVVWESTNQDDPGQFDNGIYMRMFDANGSPLGNASNPAGDEALVYTASHATGNQSNPDIAINDSGQFAIAWDGQGPSDVQGVYARTFNQDGTAASAAFLSNNLGTGPGSSQQNPSVGIAGDGTVTVAWDEVNTTNVEARQFDFNGNALGQEFIAPYSFNVFSQSFNTTDPGQNNPGDIQLDFSEPSIDVREDGYIAIAATASSDLDPAKGIVVIMMEPDFSSEIVIPYTVNSLFPLDVNFTVNDSDVGDQINPAVVFANDDSDSLIVSWEGEANLSDVNDNQGVFARQLEMEFNGNGDPFAQTAGPEFTIHGNYVNGFQANGSLAMVDVNNFVAVWSGEGSDDSFGTYLRAFGDSPPNADDDSFSTDEDSATVIDVFTNDSDDTPLVLQSFNASSLIGALTSNGDGTFQYDPDGQFENLNVGVNATENFSYTIVDSTGSTSTANVVITIAGVNDSPIIDANAGSDVTGGSATGISNGELLTLDQDNSADELTYTLSAIPDIANGQLFLAGNLVPLGIGATFTQEDIDNGLLSYVATASVSTDSFEFSVSDPGASSVTGTFDLRAAATISGTVYEDVDGDGQLGDAVAVAGVDVRLYLDSNADGIIDAGDVQVDATTTDGNGLYSFQAAANNRYFVAVDSKDITPSSGLSGAAGAIWAEQTYGSAGSFVGDVAVRVTAGTAFGGRRTLASDGFDSGLIDSEHVTQLSTSGGDVSGLDFGFSFNVVTNHLGGDAADHDLTALRTVQGSLRQFIENANAITGHNEMRFTPVSAPTTSDGINDWWTIDVSVLLPELTDDAGATINGAAYSFLTGVSTRNLNTSIVGGETGNVLPGSDGVLGTADDINTVGTGVDGAANTGDEAAFQGVEGSELTLLGSAGGLDYGLRTSGDLTVFDNLTVRGFGSTGAGANIWVQSADQVRIEEVLVGGVEAMTSAQLAAATNGSANHGILIADSDFGDVFNSAIVGSQRTGIKIVNSDAWTISNNEIRNNALGAANQDGIDMLTSRDTRIFTNLIDGNGGAGIDSFESLGGFVIEDNTIRNNGFGGLEGAGIRLFGDGSVVAQNIIESNDRDGVLVIGQQTSLGAPAAIQNEISRNSFLNNGQRAIDLGASDSNVRTGDGVNNLDGAYDPDAGNEGLDRPVITAASTSDLGFSVSFNIATAFGQPKIELYLASPSDPSDLDGGEQFGEGMTYLRTLEFDGSNYVITHSSGIAITDSDRMTAIAIDGNGNTSEFSNVIDVNASPVALDDAYSVVEGATVSDNVGVNDTDADGDALVFSASGALPTGLNFNSDGTFDYTPQASFVGTVTFDYIATDPGGLNSSIATVTITVTPTNDQEIILTNGLLIAGEGLTSGIDATLLETTDTDNVPADLVYSVTGGPAFGQLELTTNVGSAVTTFTQADIDSGLLVYVHDSSDSVADFFDFDVDDGDGTPSSGRFQIQIDNAEQVFDNSVMTELAVSEGRLRNITSADLQTTDADDSPTQLVYVVATAPTNGELQLSSNPGTAVSTFTQADIDSGLLFYVHDSSDTTTDFFQFVVDDGQGAASIGQIDFSISNVEEVLRPMTPLTVAEGGTGLIDNSLLRTTDADDVPVQRIYTVDVAPLHGRLELTTNPGTVISTFTQRDVNQGNLIYFHDGTDSTNDTFEFTVDDGQGTATVDAFDIVIVNAEQTLVTVEALNVVEGAVGQITNSLLLTTDPDDAAAQLVYVITSDPTDGQLELTTAPGVAATTFTQADIDNGLLVYRHDGSEFSTDSFDFTVDDGQGGSTAQMFAINVDPVNDSPTISSPGPQDASENTDHEFSPILGNGIILADADVGSLPMELSIQVTNGVVSLSSLSGLSFVVGDGMEDALIRVQGNLDDLNSAVDGLVFRGTDEYFGSAAIDLEINDLGNAGTPGPLVDTTNIPIEVFEYINASNDDFSTLANESLTRSVVGNDTVSNAEPPVLVEGPTNGVLTWIGDVDGSFYYTPNPGFAGTDAFTYELGNGVIADQATVLINVLGPANSNNGAQTGGGGLVEQPAGESDENEQDNDNSMLLFPGPGTQNNPSQDSETGSSNATPVSADLEDSVAPETTGPELNSPAAADLPVPVIVARASSPSSYARSSSQQILAPSLKFVTGAFSVGSEIGDGQYYTKSSSISSEDHLSADSVVWQVPTGLVLTGGLSVGWVIWSLNSGYLLGSMLSTLSPWTLMDPLPVLESVGPSSGETTSDDKLENMVDK